MPGDARLALTEPFASVVVYWYNGHYKFILSAGAPDCRQAGGRQESKKGDNLSGL